MPDYTKVVDQIILVVLFASAMGVLDLYSRWDKGKALRDLKKLKHRTKIADYYIEEYKHFFAIRWWHWVSAAAFIVSLVGIAIDSY